MPLQGEQRPFHGRLAILRGRNRESVPGGASLAAGERFVPGEPLPSVRSWPAVAQALRAGQAVAHARGRPSAISAAIPTAMPGKSRRIPLSSVTREMPIDLAKATNSQS